MKPIENSRTRTNTLQRNRARINTLEGSRTGSPNHRLNDGIDDHVQHTRASRRRGNNRAHCGSQKSAGSRTQPDHTAPVTRLRFQRPAMTPHTVLFAFHLRAFLS
ncbi:hypothetical protein BST29_23360 [Mycobacterium malmoense]|uniref:Uncharacterized protein n=1 Tax=Mycobacterium malmoense TaxID=1780 RepID=A0ABX3SMA5_MYCMA|nr:hypothetical protein [Mycobacterium malmoense]OIN82081.1 hypothetical protein BMG05_04265 [Mycobacterium malmoense]ORA77448.1 hypothetical protein BST29_23360 [Mycobacterium malmoense]